MFSLRRKKPMRRIRSIVYFNTSIADTLTLLSYTSPTP